MPAPYPLIDMPPGDFSNIFDFQAINMAAAHNQFIQGINAMVYHAPRIPEEKVQPFVKFSLIFLEHLHHHHTLEETLLFPEFEKKLGQGSLSVNIEQHHDFVPQIDELERHLKDIQSEKVKYDGKALVERIDGFGDIMIEHLNEEIATLESSRMRSAFTEKELKDIDAAFMKEVMASLDLYTALPFSVVCGNPATPWFPPLPAPLKWATKWWFYRRHKECWEFGQLDLSGKPRPEYGI
ncbi:hypothetical protein BDQ12DRAFT_690420 [Crucibulum laeve]|uniref:Hemerythrin-like domain-containing protein n=1 Tax=Crucibulum laeve TaxID=68775 RepID=A0A5C3LNP6_9AGAR|nr:hypothetical protein BDQ12DRAFT_690420 [Crucibulum laeve]